MPMLLQPQDMMKLYGQQMLAAPQAPQGLSPWEQMAYGAGANLGKMGGLFVIPKIQQAYQAEEAQKVQEGQDLANIMQSSNDPTANLMKAAHFLFGKGKSKEAMDMIKNAQTQEGLGYEKDRLKTAADELLVRQDQYKAVNAQNEQDYQLRLSRLALDINNAAKVDPTMKDLPRDVQQNVVEQQLEKNPNRTPEQEILLKAIKESKDTKKKVETTSKSIKQLKDTDIDPVGSFRINLGGDRLEELQNVLSKGDLKTFKGLLKIKANSLMQEKKITQDQAISQAFDAMQGAVTKEFNYGFLGQAWDMVGTGTRVVNWNTIKDAAGVTEDQLQDIKKEAPQAKQEQPAPKAQVYSAAILNAVRQKNPQIANKSDEELSKLIAQQQQQGK